jgi:hypothetical protein
MKLLSNNTGISYYPFGMTMPKRSFKPADYRYGFGAHEKDDEVSGNGNHLSFGDYGYDPRLGRRWNVDPMLKDWESPFATFADNPIYYVDPNGLDWVHRTTNGVNEYYYDRKVRSQTDVDNKYGQDAGVSHIKDGTTFTAKNKNGDVNTYTFTNDSENNLYGTVADKDGNIMPNDQIIYGRDYTIFGTSDNSLNAETLHKNLFGSSYTGPNNPIDYNGNWSYQYNPKNRSEFYSIGHDKSYDAEGAVGIKGALLNTDVLSADWKLAGQNYLNYLNPTAPILDRGRSGATAVGFTLISIFKTLKYPIDKFIDGATDVYMEIEIRTQNMLMNPLNYYP